jgi:hypothetical protein
MQRNVEWIVVLYDVSTISCIFRTGTSIQTINNAGIMEVLRLTGGETCILTEDKQ